MWSVRPELPHRGGYGEIGRGLRSRSHQRSPGPEECLLLRGRGKESVFKERSGRQKLLLNGEL